MPAAAILIATLVAAPGGCPAVRDVAPPLRPIESAVADRDPLSVGFRMQRVEMRVPSGFETLYAVEGDDRFVRRNGAVWALFPRGTYAKTKQGTVATVPPGTRFSIGVPADLRSGDGERADGPRPASAASAGARSGPGAERISLAIDASAGASPRHPLDLDGRIDHTADPGGVATAASAATAPEGSSHALPRFVVDESYRRARLDSLIAAAR